MAFSSLNEDQTAVVAVYARPQEEPTPAGYTEIPDDDPRILVYIQSVEAEIAKRT